MASRFWVCDQPRRDWDTQNDYTNWSETSGGPPGASLPSGDDDVFLDGNSGTGLSMISDGITINSLDCTGYEGELRLACNLTLTVNEGFILDDDMTYTSDDFASLVKRMNPNAPYEPHGKDVQLAP